VTIKNVIVSDGQQLPVVSVPQPSIKFIYPISDNFALSRNNMYVVLFSALAVFSSLFSTDCHPCRHIRVHCGVNV